MENNINETLNLSGNSDTQITETVNNNNNTTDEKTLKTIANLILVVGIISSLILLFTVTFVKIPGKYSWENEMAFNASGLVITIGTLFSSIGLWALLRVISNISISLKELNIKK